MSKVEKGFWWVIYVYLMMSSLIIAGIHFEKDKGQHILKNPQIVTNMVEKVNCMCIYSVTHELCVPKEIKYCSMQLDAPLGTWYI